GRLSSTTPDMALNTHTSADPGHLTLQPDHRPAEKLKKQGLDSRGLQRLQAALLESIAHTIEESLPQYLIQANQLMPRRQALVAIHFPETTQELQQAIRRLKFDELFFIQLKLLRTKMKDRKSTRLN